MQISPVPEGRVTTSPSVESGFTQYAWSWATQSLPEVSAEVQSALEAGGLKDVTASAEAFGENCITGTGQVHHSAIMEIDLRFVVQTASLEDHVALGTLLEQILKVVDSHPPVAAQAADQGYIGVTFMMGSQELRLWFHVTDWASARQLGLHGVVLLDQLQNQ